MRDWLYLLLRIGAIFALLAGAAQAQPPCDPPTVPAEQAMVLAQDAHDGAGGIAHGKVADHPGHTAGGALCKHLCMTVALSPGPGEGSPCLVLRSVRLRLPDGLRCASLARDRTERPPKIRV